MKIVASKTEAEIFDEWDRLAEIRYDQINMGKDLTYSNVLCPQILSLCTPFENCRVLDAGCGIGTVSMLLAKCARSVIGIDPSIKSIAIAKANSASSKIQFMVDTLESYAISNINSCELVIANMTLACTLDLSNFMSAVQKVLVDGGRFVFSVPHPCFWPSYYGYADHPSFRYEIEAIVEAPFRITLDGGNGLVSTHVHRPISTYVESFNASALLVEVLREPMPSESIAKLYPMAWTAPRYLLGSCRKK